MNKMFACLAANSIIRECVLSVKLDTIANCIRLLKIVMIPLKKCNE